MGNTDFWIRLALTEIWAVLLLAFVYRRQLREKTGNVWLRMLLVGFALYMGWMLYMQLSPVYFFRRFSFSVERVNLVPFRALSEWLSQPFAFFGTVLLYVPLGFFEVLLNPGKSRKNQLLMAAATAALLSLLVEFAQCFNYRVPDIDDVILNTLGGLLGVGLCILQQKIGFDRTRIGRLLLPAIPSDWSRQNLLNRFCILLIVTMELALFVANYVMTQPKAVKQESETNMTSVVFTDDTEETGVTTEPTAVPTAESASEPTPEPTAVPTAESTAEPTPESTAEPTPEPTAVPRTYDTSSLELEARNVLLVRMPEGKGSAEVIYARGSEDSIYPASTLKMLTALTVLEIASPEEEVTLGLEIYIPPLDAARAGLEYGMTLTVRDLLKALLLPSGADAAYALATYCGRKSAGDENLSASDAVTAFVEAMNRRAEAIGASNTKAVNVVGLDDKKQQTTTVDILKIARVFLQNPVLSEICGIPGTQIQSRQGKIIYLSNTNKMLHDDSPFYNSEIEGVKTGTTSKAGNCLVSVFTIGEERYLCIVMHSSYDGKFRDTQALFDLVNEGGSAAREEDR